MDTSLLQTQVKDMYTKFHWSQKTNRFTAWCLSVSVFHDQAVFKMRYAARKISFTEIFFVSKQRMNKLSSNRTSVYSSSGIFVTFVRFIRQLRFIRRNFLMLPISVSLFLQQKWHVTFV